MTFNELSEHWNELRNAALGRGTSPNVSPKLASEVAFGYEAFKAWLEKQGVIEDAVATTIVASEWITLWRALAERVRAEGQQVAPMAETVIEAATETAKGIGRAVAIAGGALVAALLVIIAVRSKGDR